MNMKDMSISNEVRLFKAGNSWNFRVTSQDRKELSADKDTVFEKIVDPDGQQITFRKLDAVDPELEQFMHDFYSKHGELMKKLEES